ncbi:MAG: DUF4259 domain-containing protein [Anaerolineae bacterium]
MADWAVTNALLSIIDRQRSITAKARRTIEAILSDSELLELWKETDELRRWMVTVIDLLERLG